MNLTPKIMPCDVVMPSLGDTVRALVENNIFAVIILLVILLVIATIITICIVYRKKNRDNNCNISNSNTEGNNPWEN